MAVDGRGTPQSVEDALALASARGERLASIVRLVILGLAIVQFLFFNREALLEGAIGRFHFILLMLIVLLGASLLILKWLQSSGANRNLMRFSVTVDGLAVFLVTAPTAYYPDERYTGILDLPNLCFYALAVIVSGFRLEPRLAVASWVLNTLCLSVVLTIDSSNEMLLRGFGMQEVVLAYITMISAGLLAYSMAHRSRNLAVDSSVSAFEEANVRRQLGVYVPEEVVELAITKGALGLEGKEKEVAVLFVDLRGFTALCVDLDPCEVVTDLNAWLHEVVEVVQQERGTVDKYIGDCVMAVFGMVETEGNEASRCLRTAARIVDRMKEFNDERVRAGMKEMHYGVGAHYGMGIVGSMGGAGRLQYTVIGDVVNRASRLEAATKNSGFPVLLSQVLIEKAKMETTESLPEVMEHDPVVLKGIEEPVQVGAIG